jgi:hypothetical protein
MTTFKRNRPLVNSIVTGIVYFLFCWTLDFGEDKKMLFYILMMFLPGLTFPLTTTHYNLTQDRNTDLRLTGHIILSILIYHGSVWLFSAGGRVKYMPILAAFLGSLFYLVATKFLLKKRLSFFQIALTSMLSGLAFFPSLTGVERPVILFGLPVFMWTIINGLLMNYENRHHYR